MLELIVRFAFKTFGNIIFKSINFHFSLVSIVFKVAALSTFNFPTHLILKATNRVPVRPIAAAVNAGITA
jgi:hypothetical protein